MALLKPLVIVDGHIRQLQSGDTPIGVSFVEMTNNNASPIVIGHVVYCDWAGTVDLARANALGAAEDIGFVKNISIAAAADGYIQTNGVLEATTGQWDAVAGTTGGLTAGAVYYLDPSTAGNITETAPIAAGQYVIRAGKAISTTELEISITEPIKL